MPMSGSIKKNLSKSLLTNEMIITSCRFLITVRLFTQPTTIVGYHSEIYRE